ncbi:zf-HC2 domain-containing protein [Streptomyces armeniacus]|uniref:Zf-HC2 domain-containing protein n=1 Tax=Streptomyces armeniacus TaxID=83291 RepID=A0A345XY65_9ACTN|nr:zf-HC2 domain-containing protein [Streptomyces armeniacus]AXK36581.1 zf-HC2 domain-containing protein [Streptomyces armeniacus]
MTSPPFPSGTDEHPEVAEISALAEGQLTPERGAAVRAHLADCALCTDVRASLDDIRGLLGTLPGPPRMPEDVASRIDAALAAEALLNATAPDEDAADADAGDRRHTDDVSRGTEPSESGDADRGTPADVSRGTEPLEDNPRTPGRATPAVPEVSRETGAGRRGGGGERPPGRSHAATGPGRRRTPRRWRTALLATAGAMAALGLGAVIVQGISDPSSNTAGTADRSTSREAPESGQDSGDGGDRATDALGKRVRALLGQGDGAGKEPTAPKVETNQSPGDEDSPLQGDGATSVPSCVREGIGRAEAPLAVDPAAQYRGSTAYLVVLPHVGDSRFVDAYVVDPDCVAASAEGRPGEVLTKRTYARD